MSHITYRPAKEQDLERTFKVFIAAINHLHAAHNAPKVEGSAPRARAMAFRHHALKHDARRFWVAEDAGQVVGFGVATLRQHLCYLAALHVLPDYQGHGVGLTLLELSMGTENAAEARIRTTIAESLSPVSNGLYARFGMYQWVPLMLLTGAIPDRDVSEDSTFASTARRLTYEPAHLAGLAGIDGQVFGVPRDIDHELWMAQPDMVGYLFGHPDSPEGYAYFSKAGAIGPVAAKQAGYIEEMLGFCLTQLRALGVDKVNMRVPGFCRHGLRYLLAQGLRYEMPQLLLASEPYGQMDRYIPSGSDALV